MNLVQRLDEIHEELASLRLASWSARNGERKELDARITGLYAEKRYILAAPERYVTEKRNIAALKLFKDDEPAAPVKPSKPMRRSGFYARPNRLKLGRLRTL